MYNMINVINTAVYYVWKWLRVNPKTSQHKEKNFFSISLILYLYKMMDAH